MDMYLTADGQRLSIPLLPDRINIKDGAIVTSFQTIKGAEYKIPRGKTLTGYSWNGVFPGLSMATASFVHDWQQPSRIASTLTKWMEEKKIIRFMLTETNINADVFIENFVYEYYGAGNMSYTINLSAYKPLIITTAPPQPEVIIPQEVEETITISESSPPSSSASSSKKKKSTASNTKKDTEPSKLTSTVPTSVIADAVSKGFTAITSFASSFVDMLKQSTPKQTNNVTASSGNVRQLSKSPNNNMNLLKE